MKKINDSTNTINKIDFILQYNQYKYVLHKLKP